MGNIIVHASETLMWNYNLFTQKKARENNSHVMYLLDDQMYLFASE